MRFRQRSTVDGAPNGSSWADYRESHERANTLVPVGGALLGIGVAAALGGVVLLATSGGGSESAALIPTGNGVHLRGRF